MTDLGREDPLTTSEGDWLLHNDYTSSNYANWRPWGLYDHKYIPTPSEAAFSNALQQLKARIPRTARPFSIA